MTARRVRLIPWMFAAAMVLLALAAIYLWWRGGMWEEGEMPTHGMIRTVIGAVVAAIAVTVVPLVRKLSR